RHTRFSRDWSSDVCSSDLEDFGVDGVRDAVVVGGGAGRAVRGAAEGVPTAQAGVRAPVTVVGGSFGRIGAAALVIAVVVVIAVEIGRASCRERRSSAQCGE